MKMVTRMPSSSSTRTLELMMLNQWISRCCGRKLCLTYFCILFSNCTAAQMLLALCMQVKPH